MNAEGAKGRRSNTGPHAEENVRTRAKALQPLRRLLNQMFPMPCKFVQLGLELRMLTFVGWVPDVLVSSSGLFRDYSVLGKTCYL